MTRPSPHWCSTWTRSVRRTPLRPTPRQDGHRPRRSPPRHVVVELRLLVGSRARAQRRDRPARAGDGVVARARRSCPGEGREAHRQDRAAGPRGCRRAARETESTAGPSCEIDFEVERVVVFDSDPPIHHLYIDGHELELSTEELMSPRRFKRKFVEKLRRIPTLPGRRAQVTYEDYVNQWLRAPELVATLLSQGRGQHTRPR